MAVISDKAEEALLEELGVDSVRAWLDSATTKLFFSFVQRLREDNETQIFIKLRSNDHFSASNYSAAREEDMTIMEIPDLIIDAIEKIRDEKKAAKNIKETIH